MGQVGQSLFAFAVWPFCALQCRALLCVLLLAGLASFGPMSYCIEGSPVMTEDRKFVAPGSYSRVFHRMVDFVDDLQDGRKEIAKIRRAMSMLKTLMAKDSEFRGRARKDKWAMEDIEERFVGLEGALDEAKEALAEVGGRYDDLNELFLHYGLK